jgi:hypothetical protein
MHVSILVSHNLFPKESAKNDGNFLPHEECAAAWRQAYELFGTGDSLASYF